MAAEPTQNTKSHPVWDVYDEYRTARLNVKYHAALLARLKRWNLALDILLAVTAPTSAIAALWFWDTPVGSVVWKSLIIVTAVVATVKPLLKWTEKIRELEEVSTGYRALSHDLHVLRSQIHLKRAYDEECRQMYQECLDKKKALVIRKSIMRENRKILKRCEDEVIKELPANSFYVPKEE